MIRAAAFGLLVLVPIVAVFGQNCVTTEDYPFDGMVNATHFAGAPNNFLSRMLFKLRLMTHEIGSDKEDFLARHYIPMNQTAKNGTGGPGTDWTDVMNARNLNIPSRRKTGKQTFVNFQGRSPKWTYTDSCVTTWEIITTVPQFHTWELYYDGAQDKWLEKYCVWTQIQVAIDDTGAPVHMAGPLDDPSKQKPCVQKL